MVFGLLLVLKFTTRITVRRDMVGTKLERRGGFEKFCKINNVVSMLNNIKSFFLLRFKIFYALFYIEFSSNVFELICEPLHGLAR